MKILVTGSNGFVGKNLVETLKTIRDEKYKTSLMDNDITIYEYDIENTTADLMNDTKDCDFVVHLAGVNRPKETSEFYTGNKGTIEILCECLRKNKNVCPVLVSSSIQVGRDNDYAKSKKEGEEYLLRFGKDHGNPIFIYRFANLFGKWCKPNYNSVIATWCYNIAHQLDIQVNEETTELALCYIDDVVEEILHCIAGSPTKDPTSGYYSVQPIYHVTLGKIRDLLYSFAESRRTLYITDQKNGFSKKLYATYLSYLPEGEFAYPLKMNIDDRGSFTEFIKTKEYGQVSINRSRPGITKGQHWHHTKNEKFLVVSGEGKIQFRKIGEEKVIEYDVSGEKLEVIDIPVGYTHNIINTGDRDMVTVMWASEAFDPDKPDTYFERV